MPAPTLVVGAPCWIDLYSSDTDQATEFYGALLGWRAEPPDERFGGYFTFTKDGKHVAGCMRNDGTSGMPDGWTVYLMTDDVEGVAAAVPAQGGRVEHQPMRVAENGTMAVIGDPGGAHLGVWQPGAVTGFEVIGEEGAPAWFELLTREYESSVDFYRRVFAWDAHVAGDAPDFRYTTLGESDGALAGIMDASTFLPEGAPASWSVYFRVSDTDAALRRARELGGAILREAEDTPYGRLAEAADATGARFKLIG